MGGCVIPIRYRAGWGSAADGEITDLRSGSHIETEPRSGGVLLDDEKIAFAAVIARNHIDAEVEAEEPDVGIERTFEYRRNVRIVDRSTQPVCDMGGRSQDHGVRIAAQQGASDNHDEMLAVAAGSVATQGRFAPFMHWRYVGCGWIAIVPETIEIRPALVGGIAAPEQFARHLDIQPDKE